ncbi:cell wall protein RBR3 isoform X1 [Amborella trichopoda]|uniref:Small ribosomal subunit protein uS15c n=1 Tax=Amborella trichopoda TaxID=13333 RepID=W1PF30_AMBTC|nr:cell wall protein RBR3 isoform X1 [Amborella trichopoda]XP_011624336.1 cell wall protein RBR3 isoform X1 [Amborella trichopoda]ERN08592.1 hypothetical protein AMTR_s00017p00154160 [Amborella trichopoda]|eukprot:XP_006847011.1 cell wall protein RBR3 isoform X1 [Amborella trichopoda]
MTSMAISHSLKRSSVRALAKTTSQTRSTIRFLSSSSSSSPPPSPPPPSNEDKSTETPSFPSFKDLQASRQSSSSSPSPSRFQDVKASLRQPSPPRRLNTPNSPPFSRQAPSFLFPKPSKLASLEEIRKNLSEFRRKSAAPSQPASDKPQEISFQELYNSRIMERNQENIDSKPPTNLSFNAIRESLRQLRASGTHSTAKERASNAGSDILKSLSLKQFKDSLNLQPGDPPSQPLPSSMFAKEMVSDSGSLKTEFVKVYSYSELGEKLRKLRPDEVEGKNWFSLEELNERLKKLREIEEKENEARVGGVSFKDLRESLVQLKISSDAASKKSSMQRLAMLGQLGGQVTPSFMLSPPKDELIEKYFHPDNMSSAEKMKLELARVRDEFKMSESDCGSSRVQVAQLTTKIKHLSSVLHKKDKHSRKGLLAMVQRRKKLLKYLRRTDWESYCFCLSNLGLRDTPGYKI